MTEFDDIRPFHDNEVKAVLLRMLADTDFLGLIGRFRAPRLHKYIPGVVSIWIRHNLAKTIANIDSVEEFQHAVSDYVAGLVKDTTSSFDYSGIDGLNESSGYLFVGNHRDIAADSMLLDYALYMSGYDTVRIAIGDNLLQREFATDLMRLNKSFIIKRSAVGPKKIYAALLQSSRYINKSITEGHSIWIAQAEGRAKDGIDKTDPALIKMFTLCQRKYPGSYTDLIASLNIVPVSIAYEYDPCDILKARELYHLEKYGSYTKPAGEDLLSLVKGLTEFKGKVKLNIGAPLSGDFNTPEDVASELDRCILGSYEIFATNYVALSLLDEQPYIELWQNLQKDQVAFFSDAEFLKFENRLQHCPAEYRTWLLKMYANPLINSVAQGTTELISNLTRVSPQ
jgi:hypothetical protein